MLRGRSVFVQIFTAAPKEVVLSLAARRALRHERARTARAARDGRGRGACAADLADAIGTAPPLCAGATCGATASDAGAPRASSCPAAPLGHAGRRRGNGATWADGGYGQPGSTSSEPDKSSGLPGASPSALWSASPAAAAAGRPWTGSDARHAADATARHAADAAAQHAADAIAAASACSAALAAASKRATPPSGTAQWSQPVAGQRCHRAGDD